MSAWKMVTNEEWKCAFNYLPYLFLTVAYCDYWLRLKNPIISKETAEMTPLKFSHRLGIAKNISNNLVNPIEIQSSIIPESILQMVERLWQEKVEQKNTTKQKIAHL